MRRGGNVGVPDVGGGRLLARCALVFACVFACAPFNNDDVPNGDYTSIPTGGGLGDVDGPSTDEGGGGSPNETADPNPGTAAPATPNNVAGNNGNPASPNTTPTPAADPCVVAILAQTNSKAVYGVGFALEAVDYPGYCVAAADASLTGGSTLRLALCANELAQAWGWSRGQFALNKRMCVTGATSNGASLTLAACALNAQQIWSLPLNAAFTQRLLPNSSTQQAWTINPQNYAAAPLVGQATSSATGVRVRIGPVPQTDGIRIHAKVGSVDLCLADVTGGPKFVGCSLEAGQVWRMVAEQWRSALGNCLIGDATARTVTTGACSAKPANTARWYLLNGYMALGSPTTATSASTMVLDVDTSKSVPRLNLPTGLTPLYAFGAPTGVF